MVRMLTAFTLELEEADIAIEEIMEQLNLSENQLKNSVGFITCSYDYIETGMVQAICNALPFDVAGKTTLTNATNGEMGNMLLCLSVLTSDDCNFSAVASDELDENYAQAIRDSFEEAQAKLTENPKFILLFSPMIRTLGGELILDELDKASCGTPIFGSVACDQDTSEYSYACTIFNGKALRKSIAMIAISGNFNPKMLISVHTEDESYRQNALITESEGSVLKAINNVTPEAYLDSIGLSRGSGVEGLSAVPFVVNYQDGTAAAARAIYMVTPEGYAICGGPMPVGATLTVGSLKYEDVFSSAKKMTNSLNDAGLVNGIIMFPCLGRNMILGADLYAEIEHLLEGLGQAVPYHIAYSGGEICPVYNSCNESINRFHNFTLIACAF